MNKPTLNLQDTFLNQLRKENIGVTIYLLGGVQLRGNVRGFDNFTILLDSPGKPTQMVYKHAVTSLVPMRPLQNLYTEALRDAGVMPAPSTSSPTAPHTVPAEDAHPNLAGTVDDPAPFPVPDVPPALHTEPIS